MSLNLHDRQKSLKRRFLLLDVIRLICFVGVGLGVILWDKINIEYTQRVIIGIAFIILGVIRFVVSYKRQLNDED